MVTSNKVPSVPLCCHLLCIWAVTLPCTSAGKGVGCRGSSMHPLSGRPLPSRTRVRGDMTRHTDLPRRDFFSHPGTHSWCDRTPHLYRAGLTPTIPGPRAVVIGHPNLLSVTLSTRTGTQNWCHRTCYSQGELLPLHSQDPEMMSEDPTRSQLCPHSSVNGPRADMKGPPTLSGQTFPHKHRAQIWYDRTLNSFR